MLTFLLKTFYNEPETYTTVLSKQDIIDMLDSLFAKQNEIFKGPNITGEFIDYPDSFSITRKWSFIAIKNLERKPAYLKAVVREAGNDNIEIDIWTRPNSVFGIFFLTLALFGIYNLYISSTSRGTQNDLYGGLFVIFIALPILYFIARTISNSLKEDFKKYLQLSKK